MSWSSDSNIQMAASSGSASSVKVAAWNISHDIDKMTSTWRIEFAESIEVDPEATFTIKRGIGPATSSSPGGFYASSSYGTTILSEVTPETWDFAAGSDNLAWACEGKIEKEQDSKATSEKDLYFVNTAWLSNLAGGSLYWRFVAGDLYWTAPGQRGNSTAWRIEHPDLPSKDAPKDSYQILINSSSHYAIGAYIASLMGCNLIATTPFMTLRSVLHFPSNMAYMEMLNQLFSMWNPTIKIEKSGKSAEIPTIYVLDEAGPDLTKEQPVIINVNLKAIASISCRELGKDKEAIDHVIIKGAKDISTKGIPDPGELKLIRMDPIELPKKDMVTFWWTESFEFAENNKILGDYTEGFNSADAPPQRRPKYVYRSETYYLDPLNSNNMYIVKELDESFDEKGIIHAHSTQYTYGPGYKLIYTAENEYGLVQKPGQPFKEFDRIRHSITDQSWSTDGLDRANTTEIVEEPVVVTTQTDPKTGKTFYCGPVPISRAQEQNRIAKNPAAKQKLIDMTTKKRVTKVNRACKGVLAQVTKEYDTISETMKINPQFLRDPRGNKESDRSQFLYEAFMPGQTVFHKAATVEQPDICTIPIASEIATRILARSTLNKERREISLSLTLPIQIPEGGLIMKLPDIYAHSDTGSTRTRKKMVPAGKYIVSQIQESQSVSLEGEVSHEQTFTLRNVL